MSHNLFPTNFTAVVLIDSIPREATFSYVAQGKYYLVKIDGLSHPIRLQYWNGEWQMHNGQVNSVSIQLAKIIKRERKD